MYYMQVRVFAALAALIALCECRGGTAAHRDLSQRNPWTIPHVLRFSTGADIHSLNPHLDTQATVQFLSSMTMAWLVKFDEHDQPYPELATAIPTQQNGGISPDGLTLAYHLRKNVKWSDGAPFTSRDVLFSIKAVLNPANDESSRSGWDLIDRLDSPDAYTVRIHLRKPYSPFLETFFGSAGGICLLPSHLLASLPNINEAAYNALPVGIGPFKYTRWVREQKVVMVANTRYFRGLPRLKEVDYEVIPDVNTLLIAIQSHALDMWYRVPPAYFVRLRGQPGLSSLAHPGLEYYHLDFNITRPALKFRAVRQALEYATDRETLRRAIAVGMGTVQEEPAPPTSSFYVPELASPRPFDLAKANALLDRGGWIRGIDGVRSRNGTRLELQFVLGTGNSEADRLVELLRSWWSKIGVALDVKHYSSAMLFAPYEDGGIVFRGAFDVAYFNVGVDAFGDFSSLYACDQVPPAGENIPRWCNRRASAAMEDFYQQYTPEGRRRDDAILMAELRRDAPTIITLIPDATFIFNSDLRGFHPGAITSFDNMMSVDI
jgi:peptide/nickel transport system substrate-binding protein